MECPKNIKVFIPESDKAGTNYQDVPLFIPNTLKFGVMKEIDTFTLQAIRSKLREEYLEVMAESVNDVERLASELMDLCQVSFTYLKKLEKMGLIVIENENYKHLNKLTEREYI